jgi:hypothetical protein
MYLLFYLYRKNGAAAEEGEPTKFPPKLVAYVCGSSRIVLLVKEVIEFGVVRCSTRCSVGKYVGQV